MDEDNLESDETLRKKNPKEEESEKRDEGGGKNKTETGRKEEEFKAVEFSPRLYKQRYIKVMQLFSDLGHKIKKVVDFGCAECRFMRRARKGIPEARVIVGVDVDQNNLRNHALDLEIEHVSEDIYFYTERPVPLRTELYGGDLTVFDRRLADVDAICCIEVIEHLYTDELKEVPESIFGNYRPYIAVFTTPNREFNVLFHMGPEREFRHWDHKFEWTRQEFRQWCSEIVERYPEYGVRFDGCGDPPGDCMEDLGPCSQIAIFQRHSWEEYLLLREENDKVAEIGRLNAESEPYKEVDIQVFPFDKTARVASRLLSAVERCCAWIASDEEESERCVIPCLRAERLARDEDGNILPVEVLEDPYNGRTVWEVMADAEELDRPENPLMEDVIGHQLGVFIPMSRIMECQEIRNLCDDKSQVIGFLASSGWTYDFILNRLFYPLLDLPDTDDEDEEDFWREEEEDFGVGAQEDWIRKKKKNEDSSEPAIPDGKGEAHFPTWKGMIQK